MKLRESFRFPYPVLTETSSDYLIDRLDLNLTIEERPASGALKIDYRFAIDSETINSELAAGRARAYLSVVCRDSFFNEFFHMPTLIGQAEIPGGQLYGRVEVRAVVVRISAGYLEAAGLQPDYSSSKFELAAGAVIAWTMPQSFSVGFEKLAPMESIFRLSIDTTLVEGSFSVSLDHEYISIRAPEKLLIAIQAMRGTKDGRAIALNSIYMPVVMAVLESIQDGDQYADRRWHRVVRAKAELLKIDLSSGSRLEVAQKLLRAPAARLTALMETKS